MAWKDPETKRQWQREYQIANRDRLQVYRREYYAANRDRIKAHYTLDHVLPQDVHAANVWH